MKMKYFVIVILALLLSVSLLGQTPDFVFSNTDGKIPVQAYKGYHYVKFPFQNKVTAYVTLKGENTESVEVFPKGKVSEVNQIQNTVSVALYEPGVYMLRLNKKHKFFIFADEPYSLPTDKPIINIVDLGIDNTGQENMTTQIQKALENASGSGAVLYFPKGDYKTFPLTIGSNTHLFLDEDATIIADTSDIKRYYPTDDLGTKRFIYIKDAENVKICGAGNINGNGKVLRTRYGDEARMRLMMIFRSKNVYIEGLMFKDPGSWNTQILCSEDVSFNAVKLMNDIELSNTDGFDPDASKRVLIENCFAYCSDDNVAIKITKTSGYMQDVEDITVRGCLFLTKKSSLKVGTETRGLLMKNILFEDNDVIESDRGMALYVSDGATLENIRYINNRFEYNYPDAKRCGINIVVQKRNKDSKLGMIKDVLIKDCFFENSFPRMSEIKSEAKGLINVRIENLHIENKKVSSLSEAQIKVTNSSIEIK